MMGVAQRSDLPIAPGMGLCGPAAAAMFMASVLGFAAMRSGYSHATKAVSELGVVGAPNAAAFNLFGYILPGLLICGLAYALWGSLLGRSRIGPALLTLSGLSLAATGIFPADMSDMSAMTSVLHMAGANGAGVFWALGLFWAGPSLKAAGFRLWGAITPAFVIFLLAHIAWQIAFAMELHVMPGYGQRLAFAGYFAWAAITGWLLVRRVRSAVAERP